MSGIEKTYVSDIDLKLAKFNAENPKSAAQQTEFDKYQAIYKKRDNMQLDTANSKQSIEDLLD